MSERTLRALAILLSGVSFLLVGLTLYLIWVGREAPISAEAFNLPESRVFYTLSTLPAIVVGAVITLHIPRNFYGWTWLALGFGFSLENFGIAYVTTGVLAAPGSLPWAAEALSLAGIGWILGIGMWPFTMLLFPTGSLPSRRWRPLALLVLLAMGIALAIGWAMPGPSGFAPVDNPLGIRGEVGTIVTQVVTITVYFLFAFILIGALSLVVRYRHSTGAERQQIKWVAFGTLLVVIYLVSDFVFELPGVWESIKEAIASAILPVTIGIAILRYRLWDIDVILRKTVTYVMVVALLLVVYFGSVVLLQQVFAAVSGQHSEIITVLSTLAIAALFVPLRNRIQAWIDRRFYRKKYDAQAVLAKFAETVRDETDLEKLTARLMQVVDETMQPRSVQVWLKSQDGKPSRSK